MFKEIRNFILLITLILFLYSSLFSQERNFGILETGEFSVHKYFYDLYRDWKDETSVESNISIENILINKSSNEQIRYKVFGYFPYWFLSRWNTISYDLLYLIAFHSAEIDSMGNVVNDHGWLTNSYVTNFINAAKQKNVKVVLSATLFSGTAITSLLSNNNYRINAIKNLIQLVKARNINGIDINFEGIQSGQRDNLTSFMRQLRDSLKSNDSSYILTCAPTDFDFRQGDWDLAQITQICDLTFLQCYGYAYSTGSQAGPVGRLQGWSSTNATSYINSALSSGAIPSKTIYGMPHYGYDWPVNSPNKKASTLGAGSVLYYPDAKLNVIEYSRLWDTESLNAWYRYQTVDGTWHQAWYEDPESAFYKYQFIKSKNLAGVGIWALGMDNTNKDIWYVLEEFVKDTNLVFPPEQPILQYVKGRKVNSSGELEIKWIHLFPNEIVGYRLFLAVDSLSFLSQPFLDENYLKKDSTLITISNLLPNKLYFVKIVAVNSEGMISNSSDIYSSSTGSNKRYLIVDGFDRTTGSYTQPFHSFNEFYATSIYKISKDIDAASNEALISNLIDLNHYDGVLWFLGDESTANKTFNGSEQLIVMNYLKNGGKLFVTGSEVGYELSSSAPNFLNNYLKAIYVADNSGSLSIYSNETIIRRLPTDINLGATYPEDWPDAIQPTNGSQTCLLYRNNKIGGIYFSGLFPDGSFEGKLVFLSFALETTNNKQSKDLLIEDVIRFFEGSTIVEFQNLSNNSFSISSNYPNPFNSETKVSLKLPSEGFTKIEIFNILGEKKLEVIKYLPEGLNELSLNFENFNSGVYLVKFQFQNQIKVIKLNLIK
ncbi:MAG: glycosyl hydrolase family 18 protein [Candidatus Anstonellales archaeon]